MEIEAALKNMKNDTVTGEIAKLCTKFNWHQSHPNCTEERKDGDVIQE